MLTLAIQAGGESRRMGTDKALLPFLGKPLILRPLSRLASLPKEIVVTSNHPESFSFLGLTPVPDLVPGVGALSGLFTAFSTARYPYVAVVACDMPFANSELFAYEITLLHELGVDAVIPRTEEGTEPFHAVYRRETCLPHVLAALQSGARRVDAWFSNIQIRFVEKDEILLYDPQKLAFFNINTPEELKEAESIVKEQMQNDE